MNSMLKGVLAATALAGLVVGSALAQSTTPPANSNNMTAPGMAAPAAPATGMANPGMAAPGITAPGVVTPAQQPVNGQMNTPGMGTTGKSTDSNGAAFSTPGSASPAPNANLAETPAHGANSFSKGEALNRLQNNGFTNPTNLTLDHDGVWRADATKDGKPVKAWLDYKGQVGGQ